ncbi:MAG: Uma2 family endonuclease [Desulfobacterales bacterium]
MTTAAATENRKEKFSFLPDKADDYSKTVRNIKSLPTEDELPCDDGEPMETARHREQMNLLIESLQAHWKEDRKYYTGGNMFMHYDLNDKRKFRGPDFFLVLDTENRERKSWVVWQEGGRFPDLIIELLSDTTRHIDKTEKKTLYEQVFKTPEYYLYDPFSQEFIGYRLSGNRYITMIPDKDKRIYSYVTGLFLVVKNERLRWMSPEGSLLPSHEECAEQEKMRAEQEKMRAEQEKMRAEQEKMRAEQEKMRAENAENRLREAARKLLENGMDMATVILCTGLAENEIAALRKQ